MKGAEVIARVGAGSGCLTGGDEVTALQPALRIAEARQAAARRAEKALKLPIFAVISA